MFYLIYLLILAIYNSIRENLKQNLSEEQIFLKQLTGRKSSKEEVEFLWRKISDHKWFISEKLGRDVGFEIAAADYLKNIRPIEMTPAKYN